VSAPDAGFSIPFLHNNRCLPFKTAFAIIDCVQGVESVAEIKGTDTQPDKDIGNVSFANDVLAIIAGLAASEIDGVAGMSGGLAGGIAELLGRKNLAKGIKITLNDKLITVEINMIITYGFKLHEVSRKVQANVIKAIETMTGLNVERISINVLGINFSKDSAQAEAFAE
jgi:uncharacterized alkaline shock family protein YloU